MSCYFCKDKEAECYHYNVSPACPKGFYGNECKDKCANCVGNSSCNAETGICAQGCADGWDGELCDRRCEADRYGANCRHICGFCQRGTCDHVTGECYGGCAKGYYGPSCKTGEFSWRYPLPWPALIVTSRAEAISDHLSTYVSSTYVSLLF
ncbi:hypothetical protein RRG08_016637 [Elysia crispata]|uniref:Uncharacterized protein n=1 Tax=Elysia crispata TaxID=231223 RepID=A0AAE1D6Y1_9GAST|nr:hypothetical protein RRG08_016637 [Elysia crispata]